MAESPDIKKHKYGLKEISGRLLEISKGQRGFIAFATIASIVGNLSQMGLMGFGAAFILGCAGRLTVVNPWVWGGAMAACASYALYRRLCVSCSCLQSACGYEDKVFSFTQKAFSGYYDREGNR